MKLTGRHFLKLLDFTQEEILSFIDLAKQLKQQKKEGISHRKLTGKNIALIFEKTSTRTRCSFETAAHDLGMQVTCHHLFRSFCITDRKKRKHKGYGKGAWKNV